MSEFATPAEGGGSFPFGDLNGSLLVIDAVEVVKDVQTDFGIKDAIRANVTVVDGDQTGTSYDDTLLFPKVLVSQLRSNVGKRVLGRLYQGQAKASQKPPWKLAEATDADIAAASTFLATQAAGRLTADDI